MKLPKIWRGEAYTIEDGKQNHWYFMYVYDKEEERVIEFYIRGDWSPTRIALVSATTGRDLENWKEINNDMESDENKKVIRWFEENILKRLEDRGAKVYKETIFRRYFLDQPSRRDENK